MAPRRRRLRGLLPAHRPGSWVVPRDRARGSITPTLIRACSSRTGPARCSCATARPSAIHTSSARPTSRTGCLRPSFPTCTSTRPSSHATIGGSACGSRSWCMVSERSGKRSTRSSTWHSTCTRRSPRHPASRRSGARSSRWWRSGWGDADDEANRGFLARINASKRVLLSSTTIDGRYLLRACIVSHRTHRDRIDEGDRDLSGPQPRRADSVPEMPEVQGLAERLNQVLSGARACRVRPASVLIAQDRRASPRLSWVGERVWPASAGEGST